jgi:hypothetical protein
MKDNKKQKIIKPCKCGSTEHSRTSNKKCKLNKPRKVLKDKIIDSTEKTSVTKVSFNTFLAEPALGPIIEDAVKRMTSITFEATRLVNLYVIYLLNNNLPIPSLNYNSFMRLPFQAALRSSIHIPNIPKNTTNNTLNFVRDNLYSPLRPANFFWNDGR